MLVFNGFQHYSIRYGSKFDTPKIAWLRRKLVPLRSPLTIKCLGFASDAPKNKRMSIIFHIYIFVELPEMLHLQTENSKNHQLTKIQDSALLPALYRGPFRTSFAGESPSLGPPTSTAGQANLPAAAAAAAVPAALLGAGVGALEPEGFRQLGAWRIHGDYPLVMST